MENNQEQKQEEAQGCTLNLTGLEDKLKYVFDYEINSVKSDENEDLNCKMYYYDQGKKTYRIINYNSFNDKRRPLFKIPQCGNNINSPYDSQFEQIDEPPLPKNAAKANCIKRLVSKQKRRLQNENFDLDMTYITDRVIAMGFPSTGCETMYRNSLTDVVDFFHKYHNDNVKIYNLCLEKDRIYDKSIFSKSQVGLFPATDHNPCPIKLILEFCVDICLYLIKNPEGVAAVHCKAGKGRTGVMICSYLIFSRICETSEMAFRYYARIRTKDNTGVTIPSQKRYIKYFETFLEANFCPPYIYLIPKIIKFHFSHLIDEKTKRPHVDNILESFKNAKSYFISPNKFKLTGLVVGPLPSGKNLGLKICNFVNSNIGTNYTKLYERKDGNDKNNVYYDITFDPPLIIHSDIKISITGGVNFYVWVNLWYSSWETIKLFYDTNINNTEDSHEEPKKELINESNKNVSMNLPKNVSIEMQKLRDDFSVDSNDSNRKMKSNDLSKQGSNFDSENENNIIDTMNSNIQKKSLYEIIFKLKHNTNLNELIDKINLGQRNKLNKNKLKITLNAPELDKFEEKKKMGNVELTILYSLME